ncbi:MFS transporter [Leifsonia flava]|uniref:MFS transporter n=2 Tax=Orlajensenia leifsoniae TaxID=2561933 RepID=A0A4Y9R704_9MICO|nr:MFS transporter [Leifsonia flava]
MMVLDASITTTALPHIQREFAFSAAGLSWVQNAYALAFGGLLLVGARAGDLLGRKRVFLLGVGLFTVASLAAGVAVGAPWLIAARAVQGAAAAFAVPSTLALLVDLYTDPLARGRAIALYSAVIGAGASVGIIVGGLFTDLLSWRWGLLINVPIGIVILILAPRVLHESVKARGRLDIWGALTSTAGMSALVFGFVQAAEVGWSDIYSWASFALAAVMLLAFILIERHAKQPITPLRLFASLERSGAYAGRVLVVGATSAIFYFLSQYLQEVLGLSALETGIAYVPITGMFFAMAYVVGPLQHRFGRPVVLVAALLVALVGVVWLSRIGPGTHYYPDVVLPLLLLGIGQGIAIILLTQSGVAGVAPEDAGAASGLVNVAHQVGGSIGIAILTVVFVAAAPSPSPQRLELIAGFHGVFTGAAVLYSLAVVLGIVILFAGRVAASRLARAELRDAIATAP